MSYILEALKKVEQKRMQEESPGSLALLGSSSAEPPKRPLWPYPVLAALLLNTGVMIWWIGPWRAERKAPSARPYAVQPTKLPPPILAKQDRTNRAADKKEGLQGKNAPKTPAEVPRKEVQDLPLAALKKEVPDASVTGVEKPQATVVPRDVPVAAPKKEIRDVPAKVVEKPQTTAQLPAEPAKKEVLKVPLIVTEKSPATAPPPAVPQTRPKKEAPPSGKVFELNDLPSAQKSALPEFKVSAHVYNTDRQNRMVRVNDKILHEGEELSPGLKVEEIIPGGIIFSHQGYRFRFGL